ncbi:DNA-binding protein [Hahella aquimaris]|uniref:DNA-binding protein n=1 Tax=Hahella sp. HNIBRBA332 TaxID=3015983 RepID=UPI00273B6169|nr:DNA-binding protein [Hahella sp. HNIBRBA332]WLQ14313.1 DNA-binding protein [Hahella sp. HNIBRBA332]
MEIKHLSQNELARRWSVSLGCLERWRIDGRGPVYLKLHGRVLYRIEDVEEFEEISLRKSTSERLEKGDVA